MTTRINLSFKQKQQIRNEHKRRRLESLPSDHQSLAAWAQNKFRLPRPPGQPTMSRILSAPHCTDTSSHRYRNRNEAYPAFETALLDWIMAQFANRKAVNGPMIMEYGLRIETEMNSRLDEANQIKLTLSNGWLYNFQKRKGLKSFKSYGESGDADEAAIEKNMAALKEKISAYATRDRYNADEFRLFYRMAPDRTIAPERLAGRKNEKVRLTFLACANCDGSDRIPLLIIGKSQKPRCFQKKSGAEHGFDYHCNKKAWMNSEIFIDWLQRFSEHISATSSTRKVLLLLDNASVHGTSEILPRFNNVEIYFLPPNTTSRIQPMDAGIIAALKKRYRTFLYRRAVNNMDIEICDIYKIDQLSAMRKVVSLWQELPKKVFWNCWLHTKLMDGLKMNEGEGDTESVLHGQLSGFVRQLVPPQVHRIMTIESLLNVQGENDSCTSSPSVEEIVSAAVGTVNEEDCNEAEEDTSLLEELSIDEKLGYIAVVLLVMESEGISDSELRVLRRVQRTLRSQKVSGMSQTRITSFFASQ